MTWESPPDKIQNTGPSGPVVPVDLYIVIGQITAPASSFVLSLVEVHMDDHLVLGQDALGGLLVKVHPGALLAHQDLPHGGGETYIHKLGAEGGLGVAHGAQHPAPVGVGAEHSGLHQ